MIPEGCWPEVARILDLVLDLSPEDTRQVLDAECAGDAGLRERVERLLVVDRDSAFLAKPAVLDLDFPDLVSDPEAGDGSPDPMPGRTLGAWRVLRKIGAGGMGTVYLAERADGAFAQRTALKVVSAMRGGADLERRFLRERQTLARLEHPAITPLFDGGVTEDGTPWLVMQYVEGLPITEWCRERKVSISRRLDLFEAVCEAVQYAHQQLVVHRDLKPGNILVTERGEVKLLDFGIARWLDDGGEATATGEANVFTPRYAAPEQLEGEPATTRTDVYSLGVLLFELLTDRHPLGERGGDLAGAWKSLLASEVLPPSQARPDLSAGLRGDLDAIVEKARRREPDLRYGTVDALLADVRAHRARRPVEAMRGRRGYTARRFLRRRRVPLAIGGIVLVSVVAGLVLTDRQARIASAERDRAETQERRARAVTDFLLELFESSDPDAADPDRSVRDVVALGAQRLRESAGAEAPEVRAELLDALARIQAHLGEFENAAVLADSALAVRTRFFGEGSLEQAASLIARGSLEEELGSPQDAEAMIQRGLDIRVSLLDGGHPAVGEACAELAHVEEYLGNEERADSLYLAAAATFGGAERSDSLSLARCLLEHGKFLRAMRRHDEAGEKIRKAVDLHKRTLGADHVLTAGTLMELASVMDRQGRTVEALPIYESAFATWIDRYGEDHSRTSGHLDELATLLARVNRNAEAESLNLRALAITERIHGPTNLQTITRRNSLGTTYMRQDRFAEAATCFRAVCDAIIALVGEDHRGSLTALDNWAIARMELGDHEAADSIFANVAERRSRLLGEESVDFAYTCLNRAALRGRTGDWTEARSLAEKALEVFVGEWGAAHPKSADAQVLLATILLRQGEAERALAEYAEAIAKFRETYGDEHPRTVAARVGGARALRRTGRAAEAETELRALAAHDFQPASTRAQAEGRATLGLILLETDRAEEAGPYLEAAITAFDGLPVVADPLAAEARTARARPR